MQPIYKRYLLGNYHSLNEYQPLSVRYFLDLYPVVFPFGLRKKQLALGALPVLSGSPTSSYSDFTPQMEVKLNTNAGTK